MDLGRRNKVDPSFSMSSMTDLVFLLLIFFIILSTMVSPYSLPVDLPTSNNQGEAGERVALRVDKDLIYSVNNKKIDQAQLENELEAALSVFPENERSVVARIDKVVPTGNTVEIFDIAMRNKWKVVIATQPEQ